MRFFYSLDDAEAKPELLGNFLTFRAAESELRKLLESDAGAATDAYLFLHRGALPSQDLSIPYIGRFALVRIISIRPRRRSGTVTLISSDPFTPEPPAVLNAEYLSALPKAS